MRIFRVCGFLILLAVLDHPAFPAFDSVLTPS